MKLYTALALTALALTAACHPPRGEGQGGVPGDADSSRPFDAIAAEDTVRLVGTEPFWGGEARGGTFTYTTPARPDGVKIAVERFAGRNGLGLSGTLDGQAVDLTITPGTCSDGMSDRRFPFTATLRIGGELRQGCAWTAKRPFQENGGA